MIDFVLCVRSWAIDRGASVFADGAESVSISGNSFDQIDGNGIFLSRYARNCSILNNDFSMIGDSAILVVGASGRGMIDNSKNRNYPAYNLIEVSVIPQPCRLESSSRLSALEAA